MGHAVRYTSTGSCLREMVRGLLFVAIKDAVSL